MHVAGVGIFCEHPDRWESYPEQLGGSVMSIDSAEITAEQQDRSRYICLNWTSIIDECLAYVEARRADYGLEATSFVDPGVFIQSGEEWSVYFDTDHEYDAIVGVEFKGDKPFQLIIGD